MSDDFELPDDLPSVPQPASAPEPAAGLVHSKVPLRPWLSETVTFVKRYFWRLFFLSLIISVFSLTASFILRDGDAFPAGGICGVPSAGVPEIAGSLFGAGRALAADGEGDETDFFAPDSGEAAPAGEAPAGPEIVPAEEQPAEQAAEPAASDLHSRLCPLSAFRHSAAWIPVGWISWTISVILGMMLFRWGIRSVQTGTGSWGNMLLPSWKTLPMVIVLWLLIMFVVGLIVFGLSCLAGGLSNWLGDNRVMPIGAIVIFLVAFFVIARYILSGMLILDRDFTPLRAINTSWNFMRSNVGTLILGLLVSLFLIIAAAVIVMLPLLLMLAKQAPDAVSDQERLARLICATPCLAHVAAVSALLLNTLSEMWTVALMSVFYLMATGQRRPGAWPRDNA